MERVCVTLLHHTNHYIDLALMLQVDLIIPSFQDRYFLLCFMQLVLQLFHVFRVYGCARLERLQLLFEGVVLLEQLGKSLVVTGL